MPKLTPLLYATLVAAMLALSACSRAPSSSLFTPAAAVAGPMPQIVVLHGDVLIVDGRNLRLADVMIPQAAPDAHCVAEAVASRQAELRLEALTRHVRKVSVAATGALDDHGRTLAHVLLDGVDPAKILIDEGLAVTAQPGFEWCGSGGTTHPAAQRIAMLSFSGP